MDGCARFVACVILITSLQAKEFLRRTLIGRDVSVSVNYTRAAVAAAGDGSEGVSGPERVFATVTYTTRKGDTFNVALQVVST